MSQTLFFHIIHSFSRIYLFHFLTFILYITQEEDSEENQVEGKEYQKTCFLKSKNKLLVDYNDEWLEKDCKTEDRLSLLMTGMRMNNKLPEKLNEFRMEH